MIMKTVFCFFLLISFSVYVCVCVGVCVSFFMFWHWFPTCKLDNQYVSKPVLCRPSYGDISYINISEIFGFIEKFENHWKLVRLLVVILQHKCMFAACILSLYFIKLESLSCWQEYIDLTRCQGMKILILVNNLTIV